MACTRVFSLHGRRNLASRPLTDKIAEVETEILNALSRLSALGGDNPEAPVIQKRTRCRKTPSRAFENARAHVFAGKSALDGRERDWWAKVPAHALRLAGTLCYLNWAMAGGPEPGSVDAVFVRSAASLVREILLAPRARRVAPHWNHRTPCRRAPRAALDQEQRARQCLTQGYSARRVGPQVRCRRNARADAATGTRWVAAQDNRAARTVAADRPLARQPATYG